MKKRVRAMAIGFAAMFSLVMPLGVSGADYPKYLVNETFQAVEETKFLLPGDVNADGSLNAVGCPHLNSDVMERFGLARSGQEQLVAGIHVYPADWFNPLDSVTGKLTKTENTYSIHWYSMSWLPKRTQIRAKIGRVIRRIRKELRR